MCDLATFIYEATLNDVNIWCEGPMECWCLVKRTGNKCQVLISNSYPGLGDEIDVAHIW